MTGRYKLYLPLDSTLGRGFRKDRASLFDDCWHRFVGLCASLERDGLSYDVQFNFAPTAEQCSSAVPGPHALVIAQGTPKPRVQRRARVSVMPPALNTEQIQKRLLSAKQAVMPSPQSQWICGQADWPEVRKRQRVIGRIIARMKAQGRNVLDDSDIRRYQIATGRDWSWIKLTPEILMQHARGEHRAFRPYQAPQPATRLARLADFAEYAYWLELARLRADRSAA